MNCLATLALRAAFGRLSPLRSGSGPLSDLMYPGTPCWLVRCFMTSLTFFAPMCRSTCRAWTSRVYSSTTLNTRNAPPFSVQS
jgi:hypothetical protein